MDGFIFAHKGLNAIDPPMRSFHSLQEKAYIVAIAEDKIEEWARPGPF